MSLSDKFTLTVDGEERELFMSFGLLNELASVVGGPEQLPLVPINTDLRMTFLAALLAKRKKSGKVEQDVTIDDVEVSITDAEAVVDWGLQHLTSFFVRALQQVVAVSEANRDAMASLESSLAGLKTSPSATQSSGPSA